MPIIQTMKKVIKNIINWFKYRKSIDIKIKSNVSLTGSVLEGKNKIYNNTIFVGGNLGRGSYISKDCVFINTEIGRYCSIGSSVKVVSSTHPSHTFVSTHPAFFSLLKQAGYTYTQEQKFEEFRCLNNQEKNAVSIGNDVWIGNDVMILGGVKIHDGAIIGSKALVTKDVAPYTIVGGIPAKTIRQRFSTDEIQFLLDYKWWFKDEKWISNNAYLFSDIKNFIKITQNRS
tara:strand:+ start:12273 stop:12962 length:690 start_codon:yes stop_codon:yes gene_type:complete